MSAIAGIYRPDGKPVEEGTLLRMREVVAYRGPDGAGIWIQGGVGLAHRLLKTTEESQLERQPLTDGRGLWITADCRIDNRPELALEFKAAGLSGFDPAGPDSCYILQAYARWGEEAPNHLLGDFAFAIWDERDQSLFCARDPIGVKPFAYHWDGRKFLFGSEMRQVLQDPSVSSEPDLAYLADFLVLHFPDRTGTPYRAVRHLEPGCALRVGRTGIRIRRYFNWDPDSEPVSTRSLEENAEEFRACFEEAVRVRLRCPAGTRAGSLLSGGLDSSAIVSVASGNPGFPVFATDYPQIKDDPYYYEILAKRQRLESHRVRVEGYNTFERFDECLWRQEGPMHSLLVLYFPLLFGEVSRQNVRTLLHGEGGDELFQGGNHRLLTAFRKGDLPAFLRLWSACRRDGESSLPALLGMFSRALVPEPLKVSYRRVFQDPVPVWIRPSFAKGIRLRERIHNDFRMDGRYQASRSYGVHIWLNSGITHLLLKALDRFVAFNGLEIRLPFLDLRLLKLSARWPWEHKSRGRFKKVLLRKALQDLLPPEIRDRLSKPEGSPIVRENLELYSREYLKGLRETPHPFLSSMVRPEKIPAFFPAQKYLSVRQLWLIMSVDRWLKHQEVTREEKRNEKEEL